MIEVSSFKLVISNPDFIKRGTIKCHIGTLDSYLRVRRVKLKGKIYYITRDISTSYGFINYIGHSYCTIRWQKSFGKLDQIQLSNRVYNKHLSVIMKILSGDKTAMIMNCQDEDLKQFIKVMMLTVE